MILYFLRHGLAYERGEWLGDDSLRPLTEKGLERMRQEAQVLANLDLELDAILTSPFTRALQTAQIIAERLNLTDRLVEDNRLAPGFGLDELTELLTIFPNAQGLMLVGHEPDFSEIISALIGGGEIVCKKGGLARVVLQNITTLAGRLEWLIPPGVLTR